MSKIEFIDVSKNYGRISAVKPLNCVMHDGEFTVILGPSGCGKSTLLRMVAGLDHLTSGQILKNGQAIHTLSPKDRGCAMVFQEHSLYPHMNAYKNIDYGLKLSNLSKPERIKRIAEVVKILQLEKIIDKKPYQMSGGQRQRVAIGRTIARRPDIFLFDEPLASLDAKLRMNMRMQLRKLHMELKTTTLFVTHDQVEAMSLADRIIVMNDGSIEQIGTPYEIYHQPKTTFVASFVGSPAVNLIPVNVSDDLSTLLISNEQSVNLNKFLPEKYRRQTVTLGLRPEDITEVQQAKEGFNVKVTFTEDLGATQLIHGLVDDTLIHISSNNTLPINIGDIARFNASPEKCHIFDSKTGLRIELQ